MARGVRGELARLPILPPSSVKAVGLRRYARDFGLRIFVETGTWHGDTTAALAERFEHCYTIELSAQLFQTAARRFASLPHVECIQGDSATELPRLFSRIAPGPALFWLDAHASGGDTAAGPDPIGAELTAIFARENGADVILVDDATGHDLDAIAAMLPESHAMTVSNNIIRLVPICRQPRVDGVFELEKH